MRLTLCDGDQLRFWSYDLDGAILTQTSELGTASTTHASPADAAKRAAKLVAAKVDEGFFAELPVRRERYADVAAVLRVAGNGEEPDHQVLVLPGGTRIPHNLWLDYQQGWLSTDGTEETIVGLLVRGDLHIDGCLVQYEGDYGPFIEVQGDLTSTAIATGGSQIHIGGNLTTGDLVGVYNHGSITVDGTLTARVVASEHTVVALAGVTALRYDGWGRTIYAEHAGVRDHTDPYETTGVFVGSLLGGGTLDLAKARRGLAEGKAITKPVFVSAYEGIRTRLARRDPLQVKSLSLTNQDLPGLPDAVFELRNLRTLDLTHNQLRELPAGIGELTELRALRLRGNGLRALPESIGNLTKLEHLDVEANCLVGLPDTLARCERLRTVNLTNNPYSSVRAAFGRWSDVTLMWTLPECLFELPALERLTIDGTCVRTLPPHPFASGRLQPVVARNTLLLEVDPATHPQVELDASSSREWAASHVRFWFDRDTIGLGLFYDPHTGQYDFTELTALLNLLFGVLVPTAEPYDQALEHFEQRTGRIVRSLTWSGSGGEHVAALFGAIEVSLARWEPQAPDLVAGIRSILGQTVQA